MKIKTEYNQKFNHEETVAVISLYPKKGEVYSVGASGVASYTKNVVSKLKHPVLVLADIWQQATSSKKQTDNEQQYQEDNSLVLRVWQRGQAAMWLQILKVLTQFNQIKTLLIHFDFSMYDGIFTSALILPFLAITRILGFKQVVVCHHVIKDVQKLSGQVGLGQGFKDTIKAFIYNLIFKCFYWLLGKVAAKVVVLEEPLKQRLVEIIPEHKISVIPHAVDTQLEKSTKKEARQRLGYRQDESVVMFFGYVNWFKGADFFAQAVKDINKLNGKKTRFVMAGGESPTLKNKHYYQQFFQQVVSTVNQGQSLELTGYVPQEKIADYFAAADLVVFPYREFMCASGVMSLVFSYQKPFIISDHLNSMLKAPDLSQALQETELQSMDLRFLMNKRSLLEVMEKVLQNGIKAKMRKMAGIIRAQRSFAATTDNYEFVLQPARPTSQVSIDEGKLAYEVEK
ncbi:MAG: glycosyltransferase [Patescibacteria group bacterium]|nr:glycosyltransferase [Patescibacteria group bacterium]